MGLVSLVPASTVTHSTKVGPSEVNPGQRVARDLAKGEKLSMALSQIHRWI